MKDKRDGEREVPIKGKLGEGQEGWVRYVPTKRKLDKG
jgi:hypothetical protein